MQYHIVMKSKTVDLEESKAQSIFDRFARFYDADYRHYTDDIDAIFDLAAECGEPILELGCGTGRVLLPMATAGHIITGIDISSALLELARQKVRIAHCESQTSLVKADLRTFDLPQKNFTFAFCTSNTLMHLTTQADQLAVLRNAHRHLQPNGLLLLDLFNPDLPRSLAINGLQELADQWEDETRGTQICKWCVRTMDWAEQIQETLFIYEEFFPDGTVRRTPCPFPLRFLWRSEAELLLEKAGFAVTEIWGDFDGNPYEMSSEHLILLARK